MSALAVAGCGPVASAQLSTVTPSAQSAAVISAAGLGERDVDPHTPVVVAAQGGHLTEVTIMGPKGPVVGTLSADGVSWQATDEPLEYGKRYEVVASAVDTRGRMTSTSGSFRTVTPRAFAHGSVSPGDGATVGVGMPITVTFDRDVKDKAAVENAMVVRSASPVTGAWSWSGDRIAQFRPQEFWPAHNSVAIDVDLAGVEISPAVFGDSDTTTAFEFGPSMITEVNARTHHATVRRDGEVVGTLAITTGKSGFETRSGTKVIMTRERTRMMDAATGGTEESDPEYYRLEVEYAMRVTNTGEFLHAAPWSVGSQGAANVSHGCVGMSTSSAQWLFDQSSIGDVVIVKGTGREQDLGNGITVWNESWKQWLSDSATGEVSSLPLAPSQA